MWICGHFFLSSIFFYYYCARANTHHSWRSATQHNDKYRRAQITMDFILQFLPSKIVINLCCARTAWMADGLVETLLANDFAMERQILFEWIMLQIKWHFFHCFCCFRFLLFHISTGGSDSIINHALWNNKLMTMECSVKCKEIELTLRCA